MFYPSEPSRKLPSPSSIVWEKQMDKLLRATCANAQQRPCKVGQLTHCPSNGCTLRCWLSFDMEARLLRMVRVGILGNMAGEPACRICVS